MGAGELNECQPVFRFLRPTGANRAAFSQPPESTFDDPTASRELRFAGNGTLLDKRFIAPTPMFDMRNIAFLFDKLMHIGEVVATVQTQVLVKVLWVRTRHDNRENDFIDQPFVMGIGPRNVDCQWCATCIDQHMNFTTAFTTVYRTL